MMFLEITTAIIIFSFVPLAVKFTTANPFTIGFFRLAIASLLIAFVWKKKINWRMFKKKSSWKLLVIGFCFFCHWITYTFSIKLSGPSVCVLGMATYGVQLIFYGAFFLGYHVKFINLICLLFILFGVVLVVPSFDIQNDTTIGLALALVSASFYAIIPIMLQKSQEFNQETRIFAQFSIALVGYTLLFGQTSWGDLTSLDWIILLFLAVLGTFIAHSLWSKVVSTLPTTTTGIVYYLITPSAMILSWLLLGEKLTFQQQIGGAVILSAALLNNLGSRTHSKRI